MRPSDADGLRVIERSDAVKQSDAGPRQILVDEVQMHAFDDVLSMEQVVGRNFPCECVVNAVEPPAAQTGQVERGLTERLAWERAGIDDGAADVLCLDDGDALAEVRRLGGALLSGGTGANHDEVQRQPVWTMDVRHFDSRAVPTLRRF